jgi:ABC-type uncharacterized transport system involved in gliding motility auxiliary subunit
VRSKRSGGGSVFHHVGIDGNMEIALRFAGYLGVVLLGFGILGAALVGWRDVLAQPLLLLHILIGALCIVAWALTSGMANLGKARSVMTGRAARFGAHAVTYSLVVAGLLIVANVFVYLNEKRWDVTEQGVYSLSPKSSKIVSGLQKPLRIVALEAPQLHNKEETRELLSLYRLANSTHVSFEILNPQSRPIEVDTLGMKPGNLLYVEYGEGASKVINRLNQIDEQSITNAIIKLTRGASKKVYYIQGHGEPALESQAQGGAKQFADALGDEHIAVEGLLLATAGSIPQDAAAVVLVAPTKEIPQAEKDAILAYGKSGGRLLLFHNAEDRDSDEILSIAQAFGIEVGRDVILDQQLRLFAGPEIAVQFLAQQFSPHPITAGLSTTEPVLFTFASSVSAPKAPESGVTYTELIKSGNNSWAEKNLNALFDTAGATASRDPEDLVGPVSIAVAMERTGDSTDTGKGDEPSFKALSRIVVFGDATWIQNGSLLSMGNRDVVLNAVNWVTGEEGGVAIGPRRMRASTAPIPSATFNIILALSLIGPELILLAGLFVWWRRRASLA